MAPPVREKSFRPSFAFPTFSKDHRKSIPWENGALTTPAVNNMDDDDDNNDEMHQYIQVIGVILFQAKIEVSSQTNSWTTYISSLIFCMFLLCLLTCIGPKS